MKQTVLCCVVLMLMMALPAAAVEVELNDGTVITAESCLVTGSFLYLTLASGAKVGYAMEDVKEIRNEPEPAAEANAADQDKQQGKQEVGTKEEKGSAFGSAIADESAGEAAIAVTDKDVSHVRRSRQAPGEEGEGEEEGTGEEVEAQTPSGTVALQGLQVNKGSEGSYEIVGKVKNGMNIPVVDVRAALSISGVRQPVEVTVAGALQPGAEAQFRHSVRSSEKAAPRVSARLSWMQAKPQGSQDNAK